MTGGREALRPYARAWFCYFAAMGVFSLYAPLWFDRLGLSALAIGAIASLQSWTRVFAPYSWAWIADHSNRRPQLLQLAGVLSAASALALALTGRWGMSAVSLCVAVLFIANGAVMPLTEASLAHHLNMGSGQGGAQYGRTRVWGTIGFMLSVTVFGVVLQALGLDAWPWLVFAMWVLLAVALYMLPATTDPPHAEAAATGALQVLRRPEVAWFFASVFLVVLAHTSIYAFFSLFMASHGAEKSLIGLLWTVGLVVEMAFFWYQGHWFDRLSWHGWLTLAGVTAALRFALMALSQGHVGVLALTQLTHAVTFAAQHAACIALVTRYFPGRLRGRGQALYSTIGYGASGVVGGVAGGAMIERWGFAAMFWAASAAALASAACAVRSRRCAAA
ncbi:MAG: MFS transporter [Burkholderiaceae bacterium]